MFSVCVPNTQTNKASKIQKQIQRKPYPNQMQQKLWIQAIHQVYIQPGTHFWLQNYSNIDFFYSSDCRIYFFPVKEIQSMW